MSAIQIKPDAGHLINSDMARAQHYFDNINPNTARAYLAGWRDFERYCAERGLSSLPATVETVIGYLANRAESKAIKTLRLYTTAISQAHENAGEANPTDTRPVRTLLKKIAKDGRQASPNAKDALLTDDVRAMVSELGDSLRDLRDRALVLIGFSGALRRSELAAIRCEDLKPRRDGRGYTLYIRRSKNDQTGEVRAVPINVGKHPETCPALALVQWMEAAGIDRGPVFRPVLRNGEIPNRAIHPKAIARLVKRLAESAGIEAVKVGAHSLRIGCVTQAKENGVDDQAMMWHGGWKDMKMVHRYNREGDMWRNPVSANLGL